MMVYSDFRKNVLNNSTSCVEEVNKIIVNIKAKSNLNAFITLCDEDAINLAKEADERFKKGTPRKLEGMLIAIKDNISTKDILTTCASKMLENYVPVFDATVIERLKNEGAIIIGKTNMDEFAMGSSNETSFFGPVLNQINNEYVPGGSSGGSAVAVGAGLCHVALGSDTGGSIRQPASFTDIIGFKPTYGTISRYGLIAFASSLDQIGIFSNSVEDCSIVLDVISGYDEHDSTSAQHSPTKSLDSIDSLQLHGLKVGILPDSDIAHCAESVKRIYHSSLSKLEEAGCLLKTVEMTNTHTWIPTYYILSTAEASSNLSRFDGIRYGYRAITNPEEDLVLKTRSLGFGTEVKNRIMLGSYVLSAGYNDAYYLKSQKSRRLIYENYCNIFKEVDFLFMPTTPTAAFKLNEKISDPIAMYLSDFFTASANLAGIPAISIPVSYNIDGLPVGMQIQARHFDDEKLLSVSKAMINLLR